MLYSSFYFIAIVIRFTIVVIYYLHQQMRRELSEIYRNTLLEPRGENVEKMIKLRQSVFEDSRYLLYPTNEVLIFKLGGTMHTQNLLSIILFWNNDQLLF